MRRIDRVVIPRYNRRTGSDRWVITRPILLPSDIEVVLDNCYLIMADGVIGNMFRNSAIKTEKAYDFGATEVVTFERAEERQKNIIIKGEGHAVLDGGKSNNILELNWRAEGRPNPKNNNIILLSEVDGFEISDITVTNPRWWAVNIVYCTHGKISDIYFYARNTVPNQDGVHLIEGCSDITVERISGQSGDDLVALTAITPDYVLSEDAKIERDIHDIKIKDIIGTSVRQAVLAMRCQDDHKMYNTITKFDILALKYRDEEGNPLTDNEKLDMPLEDISLGSDSGSRHFWLDIDEVEIVPAPVSSRETLNECLNLDSEDAIRAVVTAYDNERSKLSVVDDGGETVANIFYKGMSYFQNEGSTLNHTENTVKFQFYGLYTIDEIDRVEFVMRKKPDGQTTSSNSWTSAWVNRQYIDVTVKGNANYNDVRVPYLQRNTMEIYHESTTGIKDSDVGDSYVTYSIKMSDIATKKYLDYAGQDLSAEEIQKMPLYDITLGTSTDSAAFDLLVKEIRIVLKSA